MRKNYKKIRGYLFASGVFAGVVLVSGASVLAITSCSKNNSKITIHDQLIANTFYKSDVGTPYSHEGFGTNPSTTHNCNPVEVSRIGD
jgi:hypothetical protein